MGGQTSLSLPLFLSSSHTRHKTICHPEQESLAPLISAGPPPECCLSLLAGGKSNKQRKERKGRELKTVGLPFAGLLPSGERIHGG